MPRKIARILIDQLPFFGSVPTPSMQYLFSTIWVYVRTILLSIIFFAAGIRIHQSLPDFEVLLLFVLPVIINSWFGTFHMGLLTTILLAGGYIYSILLLTRLTSWEIVIDLFPLVLFMMISILISYLFERVKRTDEVARMQQEKREYAYLLTVAQRERTSALAEIKARDEFLSIASHELKSPLTLSLLQIQRALHNIRNVSLANFSVQKLMDMLESVEQQTDRLSKMITDLSNVSLITTGRMKLEPKKGDLSEIVKGVIERVPVTMHRADYPIAFHADSAISGMWDRLRIEQVVINILSNAIKYGENRPIEITVQKKGGNAVIQIKDHGAGIPHDLQKRIFERFERGAAKKGSTGLGVGLYICHQIVTAHGGEIRLKSKPGTGSTFAIHLPLKKA